jgi:hypothetical protein
MSDSPSDKHDEAAETLLRHSRDLIGSYFVHADDPEALKSWASQAHDMLMFLVERCPNSHVGTIGLSDDVREALEMIAKGEGAFNRDPLKHAANCIESMKALAREALAAHPADSRNQLPDVCPICKARAGLDTCLAADKSNCPDPLHRTSTRRQP